MQFKIGKFITKRAIAGSLKEQRPVLESGFGLGLGGTGAIHRHIHEQNYQVNIHSLGMRRDKHCLDNMLSSISAMFNQEACFGV